MKKAVKSIVIIALMFVAVRGLAKEPKLSLTPNTEKSLDFEMDITSEQTIVSIVDIDGVVIYTEKIEAGSIYTKKFDLKNLPEGSYFLEVEEAMTETVFAFVLDNSKIKISKLKENLKPIFRKKGERVFLNLLNLEKEVVKIKIIDSGDRVVFEETISDEMLIEKVFNFDSAFKDNYTVVIKNEKDTYYENVTVN